MSQDGHEYAAAMERIAADPAARRELLWLRAKAKGDRATVRDLERVQPGLRETMEKLMADAFATRGELLSRPRDRREAILRLYDQRFDHHLAAKGGRERWRYQRRDEILGITTRDDPDDITEFSDLDLQRADTLVSEGFIDLDLRWNEAPTARTLIDFMRAWPWVRAAGYVYHPARSDERVTITTLECDLAKVPATERGSLRYAFEEAFGAADELDLGNYLRAWWD